MPLGVFASKLPVVKAGRCFAELSDLLAVPAEHDTLSARLPAGDPEMHAVRAWCGGSQAQLRGEAEKLLLCPLGNGLLIRV